MKTKGLSMVPELGLEAMDTITGFRGILTSHTQYITGCAQWGISPKKLKEDGTLFDSIAFDEGRIKIIGRGILPADVQGKKDGGPQPKVRSYR